MLRSMSLDGFLSASQHSLPAPRSSTSTRGSWGSRRGAGYARLSGCTVSWEEAPIGRRKLPAGLPMAMKVFFTVIRCFRERGEP